VNIRCKDGNTALHAAFENDNKELIDKLIKAGAKNDIKNNNKKLPFMVGSK